MPDDTMPRPETGVHQRSDSRIWQWAIKAPAALRALYPGAWAHRCSLGTYDLREANRKAIQLRAEWDSRFEQQLRQLHPTKVDRITPEMARLLAEKAVHDSLARDQRLRTDSSEQEPLIRWMNGTSSSAITTPTDRLGGMPDGLADMLQALHQDHDSEIGRSLARGKLRKALPGMQYVGQQVGILFDDSTPGVDEALAEFLGAIKKATALIVRRDQGEVIPTPAVPSAAEIEASKPRTLRDVFDRWKAGKRVGADSVRRAELVLAMYEEQTTNTSLTKLRRDQGEAFRTWLLNQSGASKTKHDRLTAIKTLLNYARQELGWLERNPWEGLDIKYRTENKREPWSDEQVSALFALPLFQRYELPLNRWRAGKDAAYWIPLIGIYTGARIGELCQLRTQDIVTRDGALFIRISAEGEGATVKTEAGIREVPMHSELERLGLVEHAEAVAAAGNDRLWPDLRMRQGKPGGYFSAWFSEARSMVPGGVPDFHSLRHTVRTKMTEASVSEAVQDRITGHEVTGSEGTRVYAHPVIALRKAVETISYPGLQLPRVAPNAIK